MEKLKIISFGEVLWDLFPSGPRFGGAPANFACHAALLGGEVTMVSAVGDDDRGHEAMRILDGFQIDTSQIQVLPEQTGTVGIEMDSHGAHTFTIHEDAAWDAMSFTADLATKVSSTDAVYFGTLGQRSIESRDTIRQSVAIAESKAIPRILDVNLRQPFFSEMMIHDSIELASILKLSDNEIDDVAKALGVSPKGEIEQVLHQILEKGQLNLVVMTCGPDGAILVSEDQTLHQAGFPTTVKDTVGAGDAFTAAFTVGLLRKEPLQSVLESACQKAAEVCAMAGAVPSK